MTIEKAEEFDYMQSALRTKSDKFYGNRIALAEFQLALQDAVESLEILDGIKKTLFYGKPFMGQEQTFSPSVKAVINAMVATDIPEAKAQDIVHSIIGKATEAGELLEALLNMMEGAPFDLVNMGEEIGDSQWYDAIGLAAIDKTFEEIQSTNIAKLRARFPDKFTEQNANVRNLTEERKVLNKTLD